ncbi:MAG: nucleotide exchange factor GrpE [Microscillaceae bacterium]|jgi:molecular chaperone GrpE|nr:nucleotide exchange factor GrpE [Microscillaceae bacterium]
MSNETQNNHSNTENNADNSAENTTNADTLNTIEGEEAHTAEDFAETEAKAEIPVNSQENLEQLQVEVAEFKDKYMRLYAEFENFRRRTAKEKSDLIKTAGESIISILLPVLDDFERAQKSMSSAEKVENADLEVLKRELTAIKDGVGLIYNKFFRLLEQKGLKPMESSIGKDFNVDEHESITQIPAPSEDMKGKVIDEVEKGYYLHEKVIRFAKVVIGS